MSHLLLIDFGVDKKFLVALKFQLRKT